MRAYKFLADDGRGIFSRFMWPLPNGRPGAWVESETVASCRSGIHACRPADVPYWIAPALYEIELDGAIDQQAIKVVADRGRLIRSIDRWNDSTREAFSHLDVAGYNYMDTRFAMDGELHPHRVIVATESHPASMDTCWGAVVDNPHVIGDFTWTGWDYLGEAGVGRTIHTEADLEQGGAGFLGEYPWLTAWCGDIDITGGRRPQSW